MLSGVYYNGDCAQSLDGKPEDAKGTLQKAIELGFSDMEILRKDADLAAVQALPDWDRQLAAWEKLMVDLVLNSGKTFPFDFALTDLSGQAINLTGYQGKVLIVDIWGTWCRPCHVRSPPSSHWSPNMAPKDCKSSGSTTNGVKMKRRPKNVSRSTFRRMA